MLLISLVLALLAVARITRLGVTDQLTVRYRQWVVRRWGEHSLPSYFAHCSWCTSMWVALPVMPVAVLFPNRWVIAALAIPAASYVTGILAKRLEE